MTKSHRFSLQFNAPAFPQSVLLINKTISLCFLWVILKLQERRCVDRRESLIFFEERCDKTEQAIIFISCQSSIARLNVDKPFFYTFACLHWLPLFELTELSNSIYHFFSLLITKRHQIEGFVIMPNHLHLFVYMGNNDTTINTLLANSKRFLAYEIVKRLENKGEIDVLKQLSKVVTT